MADRNEHVTHVARSMLIMLLQRKRTHRRLIRQLVSNADGDEVKARLENSEVWIKEAEATEAVTSARFMFKLWEAMERERGVW